MIIIYFILCTYLQFIHSFRKLYYQQYQSFLMSYQITTTSTTITTSFRYSLQIINQTKRDLTKHNVSNIIQLDPTKQNDTQPNQIKPDLLSIHHTQTYVSVCHVHGIILHSQHHHLVTSSFQPFVQRSPKTISPFSSGRQQATGQYIQQDSTVTDLFSTCHVRVDLMIKLSQ